MRKPHLWAFLVALVALVVIPVAIGESPGVASPAQEYSGTHFGAGNLPPGCTADMTVGPGNVCYHMRTDLNGLDSPQVDVLVMVPVSPTAERDMRVMRQSVEMWEGGIDYLSAQMGLDWLAAGVDFHITVDYVDLTGDSGGEFSTYPIVDPEIVVIATNPVGGAGIGVDPVDFVFTNEDLVPCHNVENPFDFEYWDALPGFDRHHDERAGTFTEDCGGAGGNICFAVNGAVDPLPENFDFFRLFDLVSHEFGHCLTLGHVGDGAEGAWGALPANDIMAYSKDPAARTKCVSTLDIEGFAIRMSKYLDVNGRDGVTSDDVLEANDPVGVGDPIGEGSNPFQVQHPGDHLYASGTGSPLDCPQPDLGPVPGARTDWTPDPVASTEPVLVVSTPDDGAVAADGAFQVSGTVGHYGIDREAPPAASHDDADDDATTALTEIQSLDVAVTDTHLDATIQLEQLWPSTDLASATSYSLVVDTTKFDSFVRYPIDSNPRTWDNGANAYLADGSSSWDLEANTVTFHLPRSLLATRGIEAPYRVGAQANFGTLFAIVSDDSAPDSISGSGESVEVGSGPGTNAGFVEVGGGPVAGAGALARTVHFQYPGGNTFQPQDSTLGARPLPVEDSPVHTFTLRVAETSDVEFLLEWTDDAVSSDLDMYVTGAADSGSEGASALTQRERFVATDVQGDFSITVEPYLITSAVSGARYTLSARISRDSDGDGVHDEADECPEVAGDGADGCPIQVTERVAVYVDGVFAAAQPVDTAYGPDAFDLAVTVGDGPHELRIVWEDNGAEVASETRTVNPAAVGADSDGDGLDDRTDNCPGTANAGQANLDGDRKGDVCDPDMDGDGHANAKERAHGTDPADRESHPAKGNNAA